MCLEVLLIRLVFDIKCHSRGEFRVVYVTVLALQAEAGVEGEEK